MLTSEIMLKKISENLPDVWPLADTDKYLCGVLMASSVRAYIKRGIGPEHRRTNGTKGKILLEKNSFVGWLAGRIGGGE